MRSRSFRLPLVLVAVAALGLHACSGENVAAPPTAPRSIAEGLPELCRNAYAAGRLVLLWSRPRADRDWEIVTGNTERRDRALAAAEGCGLVEIAEYEYDKTDPRLRAKVPAPLVPLIGYSFFGGAASVFDVLAGEAQARSPRGVPKPVKQEAFMAEFVLLDGDCRPCGGLSMEDPAEVVAEIRSTLRLCRARDAAVARAATLPWHERAEVLAQSIEWLDDGWLRSCCTAELMDLRALDFADVAGVRSWCDELLEERSLELGLRAVHEACLIEIATIKPQRLRALLAEVTEPWSDVPAVLQLAACYQAVADLRVAIDDRARAAVVRDLEAARAMDPESGMAEMLDAIITRLLQKAKR